jgi:hypothetical protein
MFIVAVAGLGAAGLIHRTQLWASATVALTLAVLLLAVCRVWFVPQARTFWGPFALTGVVYLAIVSLAPLMELHYNLPTTQLVVFGLEKVQPPTPVPSAFPSPYYAPAVSNPPVTYYATPTTALPGVPYEDNDDIAAVPNEDAAGAPSPIEPSQVAPAPGSAAVTFSAPIIAGPVLPASATYAYAYPRATLFQMATTRELGNDFSTGLRTFLWVAQCLWCLTLAFAMGMVCSWLFRPADATPR